MIESLISICCVLLMALLALGQQRHRKKVLPMVDRCRSPTVVVIGLFAILLCCVLLAPAPGFAVVIALLFSGASAFFIAMLLSFCPSLLRPLARLLVEQQRAAAEHEHANAIPCTQNGNTSHEKSC